MIPPVFYQSRDIIGFWVFLANGYRLAFPSDTAIARNARYFRKQVVWIHYSLLHLKLVFLAKKGFSNLNQFHSQVLSSRTELITQCHCERNASQ